MELIGFSGYARTGKDEASKALEEFGYKRVAFADKLRNFLYALNPKVSGNVRVRDVILTHGWAGYKDTRYGSEIRSLLQKLGTEAGRNVMGENIWVDATLAGLDPQGKYVITDCRFPNEARAVQESGGKLYRIHREGVGPANDHSSETSLDDWKFDGVILNEGTLEEYHDRVRSVIGLTPPS